MLDGENAVRHEIQTCVGPLTLLGPAGFRDDEFESDAVEREATSRVKIQLGQQWFEYRLTVTDVVDRLLAASENSDDASQTRRVVVLALEHAAYTTSDPAHAVLADWLAQDVTPETNIDEWLTRVAKSPTRHRVFADAIHEYQYVPGLNPYDRSIAEAVFAHAFP